MELHSMVLMDAGMFCAGMRVKAPIYYHYRGRYVLLCRDTVLSQELIEQLYALSRDTGGVYIQEGDYEEVWNESLRQYSLESSGYERAYQEIRKKYEQVLSRAVSFLDEVSAGAPVSLPQADALSDTIAEDLSRLDQSLMLRCINMIGTADRYLYTHSTNVSVLNGLIGQWLGYSDTEIRVLVKVGLVHDLGKLKVPTQVLNKPGRLSPTEFAAIKRHPIFSHRMLLEAGESNEDLLKAVRQHHEKTNGTGYPDGLHLADIHRYARITAVSDVYDAMVSQRCYKSACSPFEILAQFKANRFSDLDLNIVNIFIENMTFLFIGMKVKLSSGEDAEVVLIPPGDCANPVVKVGNRVFATGENCKCVSLTLDLGQPNSIA